MRCGWHSVWVQWLQRRDSSAPTRVSYPRVYKSEHERVSKRDSGAGDVFVYTPRSRVMPLLV